MPIDERSACPVHPAFDPLAPEYLADPIAVLGSVPKEAPIFHAPSIDHFVVTRAADIQAIFLDHETYSASITQVPLEPLVPEAVRILRGAGIASQPSMVSMDPPAHTRIRAPVVRALTPRRVAAMEPRIRAVALQRLGAIDASAPFDLMSSVARPLTMSIIFEFLGIPAQDWSRFSAWCGHRTALLWGRLPPREQVECATEMASYRAYLRDFVSERARERDDSFTSALLEIHDEDPQSLTHEEIGTILFGLTLAGHEPPSFLIGNMIRRLLEDPARWSAVVTDPGLVTKAVDETLRFDPPLPAWRRVTTRPVTIGGVDLPAGAKLFLWIAASGRDAGIFPKPDAFDLHRACPARLLVFGQGIHYCPGSALGKLEAQIALELLIRHFPGLRLDRDREIPFPANIGHRGPLALWVRTD